MVTPKFIRIALFLIGGVLTVSLIVPFINQSTTTDASLIPPPPRTTATPDNGGSGSGADTGPDIIRAAIYGQVMDLSTGQPGRGLEIDVNGSIVRTDSDGRYSITGLKAGRYTTVLHLPYQATAAQSSATIDLTEEETATLDLTYYSQTPPTPTATLTPEPTPTPPPAEVTPEDDVARDTADVRAAFSPLTPSSGGKTTVWINPGHINNEKGVAGNITVDVANIDDLGAFQAMLNFDPKVIEVEDVTLGNFLDSTGRQTNPLVTEIDNTAGQVSFVAFTSGDAAGPDGGGTLAVVNFTSKQAGVSDLELEDVLLVARLGRTIDATVGSGRINVTVCFGDLNGDDIIDVSDVQAVAGRAGQFLGDPNYVLEYDLDNDNGIDEEDVTLVIDRLYETCP